MGGGRKTHSPHPLHVLVPTGYRTLRTTVQLAGTVQYIGRRGDTAKQFTSDVSEKNGRETLRADIDAPVISIGTGLRPCGQVREG